MKRLPFALVALSLSIPAVACFSGAGEDVASGEDQLSQATQDACNFAFTDVPNAVKSAADSAEGAALALSPHRGQTAGQVFLWGDYDGDGNPDFAQVRDREEIQVWKGKGDGNFVKAPSVRKVPKVDGRDRVAIALLASGDFDGDKKADAAILVTSVASGKPLDDAETRQAHLSILYGKDDGNVLEVPGTIPSVATPITAETFHHVTGDLDADGKDDLVITTAKGELVFFGGEGRTLASVASGFESDRVRSLAFIQPAVAAEGDKPAKAASLVIATRTRSRRSRSRARRARRPSARRPSRSRRRTPRAGSERI